MNLAQSLRISKTPPLSPFVGAGGKTTALFQLARELDAPVIVTATTHLGIWQIPLADKHIIANTPAAVEVIAHRLDGVTLVTGEIKDDRTEPLDKKVLAWLREFCEHHSLSLLIEADGSRQKPLKAPAEHEPAIPEFAELVVQVVGLSGLGKPLGEEFVHRPEIFARLSGLQSGETITPEALTRVLTHPEGGLKNIPPAARRVILLNQADTPELQAQADTISKNLLSTYNSVIIACLEEKKIYAVCEPIAGIVLAAGESTRFGQPKQLLDWRGEPFVRAVAKTALEAGLSPVIVVTGANAEQVEVAVQDLPVQIVRNPEWQSGQASSIKAGLRPHPPLRTLPQNLFLGEGRGGGWRGYLPARRPTTNHTHHSARTDGRTRIHTLPYHCAH